MTIQVPVMYIHTKNFITFIGLVRKRRGFYNRKSNGFRILFLKNFGRHFYWKKS